MKASITLTAATWNIGGGILGESHQTNGTLELSYYSDRIRAIDADLIFLQECHHYEGHRGDQVEELATAAGYPHYHCFPLSDSHLAGDAMLSLGLLSRHTIESSITSHFPHFDVTTRGPNGRTWTLHPKGYAIHRLSTPAGPVRAINAHCYPLHHFGMSPTEPKFADLWSLLGQAVVGEADECATVVGIDLNSDKLEEVLNLRPGGQQILKATIRGRATKRSGAESDFLLYTPAKLELLRAYVATTDSDHSISVAHLRSLRT